MIEVSKNERYEGKGGSKMFGYIANIGPASLVLILIIALVIFGPGKLPGVGKALGESISGFKKGLNGDEGEKKEETKEVE